MMKLVKGDQKADDGAVWRAPGLKIGELPQELPVADDRTVFDVVAQGLDGVGELLAQYHHLAQNCVTEDDLNKLMHVQQDLEARDGWRLQQLVDSTLSRLQLPADKTLAELRRLAPTSRVAGPGAGFRAGFAAARRADQPPGHRCDCLVGRSLDRFPGRGAVYYPRPFLLAESGHAILELDRGGLIDWNGDYASFLVHKEATLAAEETANALFDKKIGPGRSVDSSGHQGSPHP